jgi:hypothetical protein
MTTRAKVYVESVKLHTGGNEEVQFRAVTNKPFDKDGLNEDNTYAKYSPSADFRLMVANPALFGHFKPAKYYYVDFTPTET